MILQWRNVGICFRFRGLDLENLKKKKTDVNVFIRCIHLCFGAMEKEAVRCYEVLVEG